MGGTSNTLGRTLEVVVLTNLVGPREKASTSLDITEDEHNDVLFGCLGEHGGVHLNHDGGFLASFEDASSAVSFSVILQQRLHAKHYSSRIAVHDYSVDLVTNQDRAGKPTEDQAFAVATAERMLELAGEGQILVSRVPFDLARRSLTSVPDAPPLEWLAHGAYLFKGIDEPFQVFEVGVPGPSALTQPDETDEVRRAIAIPDEPTLGIRPAAGVPVPGREAWVLEDCVGSGGFGEVWVAKNRDTGESRAFKFCFKVERLRALRRELTLFRIMREALGDNQGIVRLYDVRLDEAPYYLELEYTSAGDLETWSWSKDGIAAIPLAQRLEIMCRVADALGAANSVGVLHKDIKPANILIDEQEDGTVQPKLTDFGIGQLVSRDLIRNAGITSSGFTTHETTLQTDFSSRSGTRLYMAPELLSGKPPTIQSDIYSLGVILYQVVVGELSRPLGQGWERDIDDPLIREDIAACVDVDPNRRLASGLDLARRLRTLEQRRKEREEERRAQQALVRTRRRRKLAVVGTTLGFVAVLIAASVAVRENTLRIRAEEAEETARLRAHEAQTERQRAEQESATAARVNDFLIGVFNMANPSVESGLVHHLQLDSRNADDVTGRDLLDAGTKKIGEELKDEPLVRARLLTTLGKAYQGLGMPQRAHELLQEALDVYTKELGESSIAVVETMALLGGILHDEGQYADAKAYFERVLEENHKRYGDEDLRVASAMGNLGEISIHTRDLETAEGLLNGALEIMREHGGETDNNTVIVLHNLAMLHEVKADPVGAEACYREALAIVRKQEAHGYEGLGHFATFSNLSFVLLRKKDYAEAETLSHKALAIARGNLPPDHPNRVKMVVRLSSILLASGKTAEAEAFAKEALTIEGKDLQVGDDARVSLVDNLVRVLLRAHKLSDAESFVREVFAERTDKLAHEHPAVRNVLWNLTRIGSACRQDGKLEDAERIHRDVLQLSGEFLGEADAFVPQGLLNLANALADRGEELYEDGDTGAAIKAMEESVRLYERAVEMNPHPVQQNGLAMGHLSLGRLYATSGMREDSIEEWRKSVDAAACALEVPVTRGLSKWELNAIRDTHVQGLLELGRVWEAMPEVEALVADGWDDPRFLALCEKHGITTVLERPPATSGQ